MAREAVTLRSERTRPAIHDGANRLLIERGADDTTVDAFLWPTCA